MSRFFVPISPVELRDKVHNAFDPPADAVRERSHYAFLNNMRQKLASDLKVDFDAENFSEGGVDSFGPDGLMGLVSLGHGLTFWGFCAGGDWEVPVFWLVYWDGRKLRAYIPKEGNPWNATTSRAYGNDDEADLKDAQKRWPKANLTVEDFDSTWFDFDSGLILNDVLDRIRLKSKR